MRARPVSRTLAAAVLGLIALGGCGEEKQEEPTGPAVITTQPSYQTVTEGNTAVFTVAATGEAPISYQWQRDGKDIPFATKPTFSVFSASPAVSGTQYSCVVSNALGSEASLPAVLTVQRARPTIDEHPRDVAVTAGESAEFRAFGQASGTVGYQWKRGLVEIFGETSWRYTLDPAALVDSGAEFRFVVSNEAGSVTSDPATLTVTRLAILAPATFVPLTAIPGALIGADYSFQLEGAGGTLPYIWTVTAGMPPEGLTLGSDGLLWGNPAASGSEAVTIQMQDEGGFTVEKDFTITVYEPGIEIGIAEPEYTLDNIWGIPGDPLTATLTATGTSGPCTWSVVLGSLPDGLALAPDTGVISGTPPRGGLERALVRVMDDGGRSNLATVTFWLSPVGQDMPRLMLVDHITDGEGIRRMAITTWSASPMASVTVDALFMSSAYPTRLHAFSPPTTPEFLALTPGPGEEIWELPALDGGAYMNRRTLTDSQGRTTVLNPGAFEICFGTPGFETRPIHDSDGDGVPDSCDTVAGDDPLDAFEIHRDVVLRDVGPGEDVTPPEVHNIILITVGVPGAMNARHFYRVSDESFVAGGEAYIGFPNSSPLQIVTVPLAFHTITQPDPDFLKGFPGVERWVLPYIPCDYEIHGARFWDRHGNVLEQGMGDVSQYHVEPATVPPPAVDVDVDSIHDGWETTYFATPSDCDPFVDSDSDGYYNWEEYLLGGNPTDTASVPVTHDSDFDGVPDAFDPDDPTSYVSRYTPLPPDVLKNYDSDGDGMPDIWESCYALDPSSPADAGGDPDSDGLVNVNEFLRGDDPYDADSDNDGTGDAADDDMGSYTSSSVIWGGCAYTPEGWPAAPYETWPAVRSYDGSSHVAAPIDSYYPLAWAKITVRLYPTNEVVVLDATKVGDPMFYGMWWITDEEVWATAPVGEYFQVYGYFACDTHGRVTGY